MAIKVLVTWKSEDGNTWSEDVYLLSDNDDTFIGHDETFKTGLKIEDLGTDRVWFEDDQGVFGLRPESIISIEPL